MRKLFLLLAGVLLIAACSSSEPTEPAIELPVNPEPVFSAPVDVPEPVDLEPIELSPVTDPEGIEESTPIEVDDES